jgi:multiple sugar transport system substrate-binding protein
MFVSRKHSWLWFLVTALSLFSWGLASCQSPEPPPEPVTITFGIYQYNREYYEPLIEQFKGVRPEITIELQELPFIQGYDIRDYPGVDVIGVDLSFFLENEVSEVLLDLSPLIEQDRSLDLADFYPGTVDLFSSDDKVWSLPAGINPFVMYYNKDLFDLHGLSYPTAEWTWDDLLNAAVVIRDDSSDTYGYGVLEQYYDINALILISQHGGQLFDDIDEPTRVVYNHPLNVEALQWYGDLYHWHDVAPTIEQANTAFGFGDQAVLRGVLQNKIGMWSGYYSERGGVTWPAEWDDLSWGMVPLPMDLHAVTSGVGTGYAITAGSQHPEAAWVWLLYLSEQVPRFSIPARRSVAGSKAFETSVGQDVAVAARQMGENVTLITPDLLQFGDDLQYLHQVVLDTVNGDATAAEALDWAQEQVDG